MTDALHLSESAAGSAPRDNLDFRRVLQIFLRTWPFIRPSLRHILGFIGCSAVLGLLGILATTILIAFATTGIMAAKPLGSALVAAYGLDPAIYVDVETLSDEARLALTWPTLWTAVVFTAIGVVGAALLYYYSVWIFQQINQRMRVVLIDRLQAQSLAYHASAQTGDAIYRLYQDSAMVTAIIRFVLVEPLMAIGRYLVGVAFVFMFSPLLALTLLFAAVPIIWLGRYFSPKLRAEFRAARERNSALTSWIQESVQGIRVIKATANERHRSTQFDSLSLAALGAAFRSRFSLNLLGIIAFALIGATVVALQAYMAAMSHQGADVFARDLLLAFGFAVWNFGTYSAASARTGDAAGSLGALISIWGRAQDMAIGLGRVFEILDLEPDIVDRETATPLAPFEQEVRFEGVRFGYIPGKPVLSGISFTANAGSVTAIVGPTGTGKSTMMSLLLRLADPDSGRVTIDGVDIRDVTVDSLRHGISIATQENILFSETVRENIRYAAPDASDEDVADAARVACADEFIERLPQGYDTALGERATKLSSGQRQRLVLARAIVRNTLILILDEPTAALDAETELEVLARVKAWAAGRCVFLITHRLSTVRQAHRVLYVRNGGIAAAGSHDDLLESSDAYRAFVEAEIG